MIRSKQKVWTEAVQKRIAMTSSMLSSIKSLKIMGLSPTVQDNIQGQRIQEIELAKKFRWGVVLLNTVGKLIQRFSRSGRRDSDNIS